jgi:raffinose/stachyose/melibiose transport system substrate-binding protein
MSSWGSVRRSAQRAGVVFITAVLVAACGTPGPAATTPASTTAAGTTNPATAAAPSTAASACGTQPVTLVVTDVEGANPGPTAALDKLNAEFSAKYTNVTIDRVKTSFNDLQTKQPLELAGPNPPDVTQIVVPNETFASFANTGLIVNLDDYAAKYGWVERSGAAQLFNSRFDSSGQIGSGPVYGIPQVQEIVAVFYNKEKLAALNLQVPKTWEEFVASLDTAKAAGEIPMMLGNVDGWPAGHVYAMVYNRYVKTADINGWTYHIGTPASFDSAGYRDAAAVLQDWGTKNYFEKNFAAVTYDDAWKRFTEGDGLYLPAGSWLTGGLQEAMGDKGGLFLAPASSQNPDLQTQGGPGQAWAISSASKNKDCAAAYLDSLTSQRAGEILIENNVPPGFTVQSVPSLPAGPYKDLVDALQVVNTSYNVSAYEGTATPTIGAVLRASRDQLMAGRMTPDEFVKSIQAEYDKG